MSDDLGLALLWLDLSQTEVDVVLVSCVVEVTQKPTFSAKITVIDGSSCCALSSGSKVSFHSGCTRIENADSICVFGPVASEYFLK